MLAKSKIWITAIFVLFLGASCVSEPVPPSASTPIPTPVAQQQTVNDGVFTEAQVIAGQSVYDASCRVCHRMDFYRDVLRKWNGRPLVDFFYSILGEMPADNPGSLFDEEYTEVIAYILSENGFPSGDTALDANNGMEQINIVSP